MKKKQNVTKMLETVRTMPRLYHTLPGEVFDIEKSEVVKWLIQQPGVWNFIFNKMSVYKIILFDPETHTWQGVDYHDDD